MRHKNRYEKSGIQAVGLAIIWKCRQTDVEKKRVLFHFDVRRIYILIRYRSILSIYLKTSFILNFIVW